MTYMKFEKKITKIEWIATPIEDLKEGDTFRMREPNGELSENGKTWNASADAKWSDYSKQFGIETLN